MSAVADLLLVPSPLLGPASWGRLPELLGAQVVDTAGVRSGAALLDAVAAAAGDRPVVLVPHSNAGLAVPELLKRTDERATVYVDAALATTDPTPLAPPAFLDFLRDLADGDGLLPPWTQWWGNLDDLFPSGAARAAVEAEQPRLPLTYFTGSLPAPPGWERHPAAYLAFGDTYADERTFAESAGWPVRTLAGRHLHQLHQPQVVASAVLTLLAVVLPGG